MKGDVHWYVNGTTGAVAADLVAETVRSGLSLLNVAGVAAALSDDGDRIEMTSEELLHHVERTIETKDTVTVQLWLTDQDDAITTLTRVPTWNALHLNFSLDGLSPTDATKAAEAIFATTLRTKHPTVFWAVDRTGITEIYGDPHDWNGEQQPGWPPRTD